MLKIAIPITDNILSKRFGNCSHYVVYEIVDKTVINKKTIVPPIESIDKLADWAESTGITDVIVNYINDTYLNYFSNTKINLFVGVGRNNPEELIEEYLKGTLQSDAHIFEKNNGK
jgi:predicted Fe-Mo cluster-binding NifX family protein